MTEEIKEIIDNLKFANNPDNYKLYNYITNLQKENQEFYQLMEIQNKREYRSKFLKDFQKEHGENVFPDYDEIYKKYDDYKQRNEKAVEYIKNTTLYGFRSGKTLLTNYLDDLLNILKGGDE